MRIDQLEASRPSGNGAEWVRLRPVRGADAPGRGIAFIVLAAAFIPLWIVISVAGGSIDVGLVGVVAALAVGAVAGHSVLAAVGPRPRLWAERLQVPVGGTFRARWETAGRIKEAHSIQITWEGREVAVERGYGATFHRATFATREVTSEIGPLSGTAFVVLPQVVMPSFASQNARIEWLLRARVRTQSWPSVTEEYLIEVLPGPADRS